MHKFPFSVIFYCIHTIIFFFYRVCSESMYTFFFFSDDDEETELTDSTGRHPQRERKYIVFESSLKELLSLCRICGSNTIVTRKRTIGSMVIMESVCTLSTDHVFIWNSQPMEHNMPLGNLLISASILFSGSSPVKAVNVLKFSRIETFCLRTYYNIQGSFLLPAISDVWEREQLSMLEAVDGALKLGGDARCCSPGHTAKYGSYTVMDLETSKVIDVQLVQV